MSLAVLRGADVREALKDEVPVRPAPRLRVICAWCPDFDPQAPENAEASHGMCPACAAKFIGGR